MFHTALPHHKVSAVVGVFFLHCCHDNAQTLQMRTVGVTLATETDGVDAGFRKTRCWGEPAAVFSADTMNKRNLVVPLACGTTH
jgi:hypothetical protein